MRSFFTLKPFFYENRYRYITGVFILIIVDILQLATPRILGRFTDEIHAGLLTHTRIMFYIGLLLLLACIITLLRYLWRMYIVGTARKLEFFLRNLLYRHIQLLSPAFFDKQNPGDLMALATNDIKSVGMALGIGLVILIDGIFLTFTAILVMSHTIYLPLAFAALMPLPCILLFAAYLGKRVHFFFNKVQEAFASLTDNVQESVAGIRVIKGFAQERQALQRFACVNTHAVEQNITLARLQSFFIPVTHALPALCYLIALLYGGKLVIDEIITLGDLVAFYGYLGLIIWPVMGFGWLINIIQRGTASMERINHLLSQPPAIIDKAPVDSGVRIQGDISIDGLSFSYEAHRPPVLTDIKLEIPRGSTIGIVGKTGSGKTTLVQLLLRLYEPPFHSIWLDGMELHDIPLFNLRSAIGYVPQDSLLFSTSLRENIALDQEYPDDAIWYAARIAQFDKEILEFPEKLDTLIGERGITLSGGQRQRVAIARAIIKNPYILILDDSLSAVDNETQKVILQGLQKYRQGRTTIIISHRISTVQDADQIIVLNEGTVIERGNHQTLLEHKGMYARMYRRQLLQEEVNSFF